MLFGFDSSPDICLFIQVKETGGSLGLLPHVFLPLLFVGRILRVYTKAAESPCRADGEKRDGRGPAFAVKRLYAIVFKTNDLKKKNLYAILFQYIRQMGGAPGGWQGFFLFTGVSRPSDNRKAEEAA